MTVTLNIPPEIEAVLSAKAKLFGLSLPDYLFSLLQSEAYDDYSLSVEEIASVQQGLADIKAGDKGISLEEFKAEMEAKIARLERKVEVAA